MIILAKDRYGATWVSHSSLSDFLTCPRAYYLKNMWKRPETGHKVQLVNPALSLGLAVHEVVEALSLVPVEKRFEKPLIAEFDRVWEKFSGKMGGFFDVDTEHRYKTRGQEMLSRITKHPGVVGKLAVKIQMELPQYWLSEEEDIILCGKIDWLEYDKPTDSVKIIDFKTSRFEESSESLQLPIYLMLASHCQNRKVTGAAYWYLNSNDDLTEKVLPDLDSATEKVLRLARQVKVARKLDKMICPHGGCKACEPLERIFRGEGELVGVNSFKQDCFVLPFKSNKVDEGVIL